MKKKDRDEQHAREIEENQALLKSSIAETTRLVGESENILRRHREERSRDDDED